MKGVKEMSEFSLDRMEKLTERYIEAEEFIMNLNWFQRLFCSKKNKNLLKSRVDKYNF